MDQWGSAQEGRSVREQRRGKSATRPISAFSSDTNCRDSVGILFEMSENLGRLLECFTLLGLSPVDCLGAMESNGVSIPEAFEVILDRFPPKAHTPGLARTRLAAKAAQVRPDLFQALAGVLGQSGIHPLSMLNWDGWESDVALDLLQSHWRGPGRPPICLVGIGHVRCADLRMLPGGLRLQRLSLAHAPDLHHLPEDLEVEETLEIEDLGLKQIPFRLRGGGRLVQRDTPRNITFGPRRWLWLWGS